MEIVLFVPGILGSKLETPAGEEVWPPTPLETLTGYKKMPKLLQTELVVTGIVERVCIDVYGSILKALEEDFDYTAGGTQRRLVRHAYDWRRNLIVLSNDLGSTLNELVAKHGANVEIKIIAHSMGGLVTRALLEGPDAATQAWYKAVTLAIFLATPHEGAPLAFARAIGVGGSSLGLSETQLKQLANEAGCPADYQLFPPAELLPLWKLDDSIPFKSVSVFDPAVEMNYQLNAQHLQATRDLHARLDEKKRPAGCRYFSIVSAAHETVTRLDEDMGVAAMVSVKSSGDGTVPIRSAAALRVQTAYVEANHIGVAQKPLTHKIIGMLLGAIPVEPVVAAFDADQTGFAASMNLSLSERTVAVGRDYEIVVTTTPQDDVHAHIRIRRAGEAVLQEIPVTVQTSAVERISLRGPLLEVGQYVFDLVVDGNEHPLDSEELLVTGEAAG